MSERITQDIEQMDPEEELTQPGDAAQPGDTKREGEVPQEPAGEDAPETERAASKDGPIFERQYHAGKRNRKHRRKNWLLRLLIAAGVIVVFVMFANLTYFEVTDIPVIGNKNVSDEEILKLSGIEAGDSIFLLNPWKIKHKIKDNLYIRDVELKRELPSTVEIIVQEREAAAQFLMTEKSGKKSYVITDIEGMVMEVSEKKKNVSLVENVNVIKANKGNKVKVDAPDVYKKALELIQTAQEGDLYFKKIQISGSLVQAWIFDELDCKGRFQNVIHGITSGELKAVVYHLYQDDDTKGTINIGDNNYCSFTPKK